MVVHNIDCLVVVVHNIDCLVVVVHNIDFLVVVVHNIDCLAMAPEHYQGLEYLTAIKYINSQIGIVFKWTLTFFHEQNSG